VFGVALVLPGAVQPELAAALGLDLAASGAVASALSLGLGAGVVAGGPLADRLPRRRVFVASAGLAGLSGLALAGGGSFAGVLAATAGIGLGAGLYETLLNAAVPERAPASAAARLALLHSAATLGAGLGAPLLGALAAARGYAFAYGALGAAFATLALLGLTVRFPRPVPGRHEGDVPFPSRTLVTEKERPLSDGRLVPWALAAFAYVGLETALSVFAVPYAQAVGLDAGRGMRALSAFWLGLLAARLAFAAFRVPASAAVLRTAGLTGALALAAGLARVPIPELVFLATGLALGVVFPLLVLFAGEAWPARRASAVGLVVGAGSLGGLLVPWLAGAFGDRLGAVAAVGSLAALALLIVAAARAPGPPR
jgi:fucose permease